jgi:META domain
MNDLDRILRSDAEHWQARVRPVANLDEQLSGALSRPHRSRHLVLPVLAAAVVVATVIAVAAVVGLGGGHRQQVGAGQDLAQITGVVWKDPGSTATVVYTKTTVRLFDGCTNQLANLSVEHGALVQGTSIGPPSTCTGVAVVPGAQGDVQRAQQKRLDDFYAIVAGPASWSRSGNTLTLTTPGKGMLHLSTDQKPAPMLVGTSWTLAWDLDAEGSEHPAAQAVGLVIHADGSFTAGLSCGSLSGTAQVSSLTIRFTKVSSAGCASGTDAASQVVLAMVLAGGEDTYAVRGTQLVVYGKSGQELVYQS